MRTTCLINNYNYSAYLGEAIDSVLAQSTPFDEVIVVDDGSTDQSLSQLQENYGKESRVKVIAKQNGGQLSAFNLGLQHATGDVLFFLDADDRFRKYYLQSALEVYQQQPVDFLISGATNFGSERLKPRKTFRRRYLGYSTLAAALSSSYVGGPTSTLSMRRSIAEKVLPYPFEQDWRIRADDVLVLGSSLVGARKYHLGESFVDYRIHGANHLAGRHRDPDQRFEHALAVHRLVEWYTQRMGLNTDRLGMLLHREFQTIESPTLRNWWSYVSMSLRCRLPLTVRLHHLGRITQYYWQQRLITSSPAKAIAEPQATSKAIAQQLPAKRAA